MSAATARIQIVRSQGRFLDFEVAHIPVPLRAQLASLAVDWLASSDFALGHLYPPAQRVWMKVNKAGGLLYAYFYSEDQGFVGKRIALHGPAELDLAEARILMHARNAARLDVLRMPGPPFSHQPNEDKDFVSATYGEDVLVEMPPTHEQLLKNLGSNKRQQLRKYTRRLERRWPGGVEWISLCKNEIGEEIFGEVVRFNSQRQSVKGKQALWQVAMTRQRWELARRTGLLCGVRLGGEFVAGGVAYLYPQDAYFVLIGHNPEFDYWNLGNLTTWMMMKKSLELGVRRFHFLWGVSEYKFRFGGESKPLYTVSFYRNYRARAISSLLDLAPAWKNALLRTARNIQMDLRNSQFGRQILALWRPVRRTES